MFVTRALHGRPRRKLNMPADMRMRGVVIGPQWYGASMPAFDTFAQMWYYFNTGGGTGAPDTSQGTPQGYGGFESWWKPALDDAALVGNCVRIIGDPSSGMLTNQTLIDAYVANYKAVIDYANSIGLYVYATNIGFERWGWPVGSVQTQIIQPWAEMLSDYRRQQPGVIGVDISNEAVLTTSSGLDGGSQPGTTANSPAYVATLLNTGELVRKYSGLPVSYSCAFTAASLVNWDWYSAGWYRSSMPVFCACDFWDYHMYAPTMPTPSQFAPVYQLPLGIAPSRGDTNYSCESVEMIHSEFNLAGATTQARNALFAAMAAIIGADTRNRGGIMWQNYDFNPYPLSSGHSSSAASNQVGLWEYAGGPARDVFDTFATLPMTR